MHDTMPRTAAVGTPALPKPVAIDWPVTGWFITLHIIVLTMPFYFFSWGAVAVAVVLYVVTGMLGITLGYHRLMAHRAFKAPLWLERLLGTFGVLALQRSPLEWVAQHRMHHAFVDTPKDPHNARQGFWWSHVGWMCVKDPDRRDFAKMRRFARDIAADPYLNWLTGDWPQIFLTTALGLVLLALGGWTYVVWGIFVRAAFVYHVTWFVNSATHKWGYRNFDTDDLSTNCWWVGLLAFGEGWHNNHHAEPDVAPAGRRSWEIDQTWYLIKAMRAVGLVWDVKMPGKL